MRMLVAQPTADGSQHNSPNANRYPQRFAHSVRQICAGAATRDPVCISPYGICNASIIVQSFHPLFDVVLRLPDGTTRVRRLHLAKQIDVVGHDVCRLPQDRGPMGGRLGRPGKLGFLRACQGVLDFIRRRVMVLGTPGRRARGVHEDLLRCAAGGRTRDVPPVDERSQ